MSDVCAKRIDFYFFEVVNRFESSCQFLCIYLTDCIVIGSIIYVNWIQTFNETFINIPSKQKDMNVFVRNSYIE